MTRNRRRSDIDPFENHNTFASPKQVSDEIFRTESKDLTPVVTLIELDRIRPDITQPRHVLPSGIAHYLHSGLPFSDWFGAWRTAASEESGREFNVDAYIDAKEDINRSENPGPIETALLQVVELAASIQRDGLTNPITVVRYNRDFTIETGERRFYAYQILYARNYEDRWKRIPAQVSDKLNVWRQASENTARQDLNAIGRARQFAILLMELLKGEAAFLPYESIIGPGVSDRYYYAQVADGEQFRIPRGKGEILLNAMGLSHEKQLRQYRALLRLPNKVWHLADDLNWAEGKLRPLVSLSEAEAIELAYQIMSEDTDTATIVPVSEGAASQPSQQRSSRGTPSIDEPKYYSDLRKHLLKANSGDQDALARAREIIEDLTRWLENMENGDR